MTPAGAGAHGRVPLSDDHAPARPRYRDAAGAGRGRRPARRHGGRCRRWRRPSGAQRGELLSVAGDDQDRHGQAPQLVPQRQLGTGPGQTEARGQAWPGVPPPFLEAVRLGSDAGEHRGAIHRRRNSPPDGGVRARERVQLRRPGPRRPAAAPGARRVLDPAVPEMSTSARPAGDRPGPGGGRTGLPSSSRDSRPAPRPRPAAGPRRPGWRTRRTTARGRACPPPRSDGHGPGPRPSPPTPSGLGESVGQHQAGTAPRRVSWERRRRPGSDGFGRTGLRGVGPAWWAPVSVPSSDRAPAAMRRPVRLCRHPGG